MAALVVELFFRWGHFLAGITWIGLLYYFNFVQGASLKSFSAEGKSDMSKHLIPRALAWFRYAALATWLFGALILATRGALGQAFMLQGQSAVIGTGAWLGTIMLFNVWVLIWPNQKKVLGLAPATPEEKTRAARVAFLASRTNTMLSIPMLFFMASSSHAPAGFFGG